MEVVMLMLTDIADTKVNIHEIVSTSEILEKTSLHVQANVYNVGGTDTCT